MNINDLLNMKECVNIEVKKAQDSLPKSLWETYSAFSNTEGGYILLGVSENENKEFVVTGVNDPEHLIKVFWDTINNKTKVSVNTLSSNNVYTKEIDNKTIIIIEVPYAKRIDRPVYLNDDIKQTYLRNGEGDFKANFNYIKGMLRDELEDTSDLNIIEEMTIEDLNKETIRSYRQRFQISKLQHPWNELNDEDFLNRIGALSYNIKTKTFNVTNAGLLMFSESYKIKSIFPNYFLDYREENDGDERWSDRFNSDNGDWTGNLYDYFFKVLPKIQSDLKTPFKLNDNMQRVDDTLMHKALREATLNMIVNADYYEKFGLLVKKVNHEEIHFENPGDIRVGIEQMKKGGKSDPRNKTLMTMFNLLDLGEKAGSGVPKIFYACEELNYIKPEIIFEQEFVRTSLIIKLESLSDTFIKEKQNEKEKNLKNKYNINETSLNIILLLKEKPEIDATYISNILNKDKSTISRNLKSLEGKNYIKKENNKWISLI